MSKDTWKPHSSLTEAPTNLKEAIDWVLRVTGKDGKSNKAAQPQPPASPPQFGCLCFLAKAVKDLLYDAKDPGSPGPSPKRYWDNILLTEEQDIVHPVLTDLGLLSGGSTSAASTTSTCAGGTEVIKALIDHLAQGLQKWVGWKEDKGGKDVCCLNTEDGIGKACECSSTGGGTGCCGSGKKCHECQTCGPSASGGNKCYLSAYCKATTPPSTASTDCYYWPTLSDKADQVHLLARIFLGSVCLIWSGLSQLGFLTGKDRWKESSLHSLEAGDNKGLGSFMAAMGYDLERLNGSPPGSGKKGEFVHGLLTGTDPKGDKGIQWQEFTKGASQSSVAEYYSSIYGNVKSKKTEDISTKYPLLVLHILASGYFRAGSAGANGVITPPPKAPSSDPRKPRTIREILYWLSALPYSQGYRALVTRMQQKTDLVTQGNDEKNKNKIVLHDENSGKNTELNKDCVTHYLMAACGYCPLVLIGIQGTIATSGTDSDITKPGQAAAAAAEKKKCPNHKDDRNHRCDPKDIKTEQAPAPAAAPAPGSAGQPLEKGQVCYGGYHLEVSKFGPLHGMYANGLFGFQMDISPAQCLDQLRIYVHHCFYQLYFLRKQCKVGVESGAVLGWQSCRYGSGVAKKTGGNNKMWMCKPLNGAGGSGSAGSAVGGKGGSGVAGNEHTKSCGLQNGAQSINESALQGFLCDSIHGMCCGEILGKGSIEKYPSIEEHMTSDASRSLPGHFGGPPKHCPVPMGWQSEASTTGSSNKSVNHFKDLNTGSHKQADLEPKGGNNKYPAHCTGNTLSHLLEYYCDPDRCHGSLVVLLRLLACITPTVPRTLGDLFGFYYYIVYIGGQSGGGQGVYEKLKGFESEVVLYMGKDNAVVTALTGWNSGNCSAGTQNGNLKCLYKCDNSGNTKQCSQYLSPLSGQQYGQLSPLMAGTYLSWLVYLIEKFEEGLGELQKAFRDIQCKDGCNNSGAAGAGGCAAKCVNGKHGDKSTCCCDSVVSCTGVLPVLYKYGFGYGDVKTLHKDGGSKKCDAFLTTLKGVLEGNHLKKGATSGLHHEINKLIYTTRLPWIFVLTVAWLVAVLYLAFGAIWPLDWTHMRSHCRGWFRKGSLSPWEVLMVGKKKGRGILEFFGRR